MSGLRSVAKFIRILDGSDIGFIPNLIALIAQIYWVKDRAALARLNQPVRAVILLGQPGA